MQARPTGADGLRPAPGIAPIESRLDNESPEGVGTQPILHQPAPGTDGSTSPSPSDGAGAERLLRPRLHRQATVTVRFTAGRPLEL
jgi:hypothetical protein